jgi:hypothetical protein
LTKFFLKASKFQNKKGTFDVNLIFKATLACAKKVLFITKKGTLGPLKKLGGGGHVPPAGFIQNEKYKIRVIFCVGFII